MKYRNGSDFAHENAFLRRTPVTAAETYNKLVCLRELETRRNPERSGFRVGPMSKRRERLTRMFWAFQRLESRRVSSP